VSLSVDAAQVQILMSTLPCRDVKLIILGSANVGKTCLLQRYLTGDFAETISVSCLDSAHSKCSSVPFFF